MANLITPNFQPIDVVGNFRQGQQYGRELNVQRQKDNDRAQLRNLAPGIIAGDNAAFDQAAAIDPTAAAAYQASGDSQVRRMKGAIDFMDQALATNNPTAIEAAYQQTRPFLSRFGQEPPATWAEAEPKFQQAKLQFAAAQQGSGMGGVQSTYVNDQNQRVALMRDGTTRILGNNDPGANFQTITADINGTPTQLVFNRRTGRHEPAGLAGAPSQPVEAMPQGGGQAQLDQDAALANQMIAAGIPEAQVDAFLRSRAQQSIATTQAVAPAMAPLTGRRKEDEAAAVAYASEAAKNTAANQNFGNQLSQEAALQGIRTQAAIEQAGGSETAKAEAQRRQEALQDYPRVTQEANQTIGLIDTALNHPGLNIATGIQGRIDPRNYLPGTSAADFNALLDQLKGKTFLQAFQSLKGGGAITEVEGRKAEEAIARLNTNQSSQAFKQALNELRGIAERANTRATEKYQRAVGENGQAAPVRVNSAADYNSLPSGATYIDPQGNQRRKR